MNRCFRLCCCSVAILTAVAALAADVLPQEPNTWTKRSPLKDAPPSPGLSYETSLAYDPVARRVIRWGGHAQGGVKGSGEQIAELWTLDPATMKWEHQEPNRLPPATCCAQQNVFDLLQNRFLRFKGAGGNHGWQWYREIYLNNSSVWNYDLARNTWRDLRPVPEPSLGIMRCASWDSERDVAVVFGGEGRREGTIVFDPYTNTWTRMQPKNEPALGSREPRSGGNLAYDAARRLHVLFGSQFSDDPHTWAYDLKKNEWFDRKPATQPPTNRNDAVLAYDSLNQVIVAVVRAADEFDGKDVVKSHLETWAYDAGQNTWARLKLQREPDCAGARSRVMTFVPDQNFFLIDGYVRPTERVPNVEREHQIWTYRHAERKPDVALRPPVGVQLTTTANAALLAWQPSPSADVTGYVVYRGEGVEPWRVEYKPVARVEKTAVNHRDAGLKPGTVYHYTVRAVGQDGKESADSARVRTQPRIVEDAVVSVLSAKEVRLSWTSPVGFTDIVGYHVERAPVEVFSEDEIVRLKKDTPPLPEPSVGAVRKLGQFERLTKQPIQETRYVDGSVNLAQRPPAVENPLLSSSFQGSQLDAQGKPYRYAVHAYRLRAVNALGVESGPSPYFLTIPSAPQHVFSREDGEQCQLKWAANPEQNIQGYRVYWMKGPRPEGPGQATHRLTAEPIREPRLTDPQAGMEPRRYWVVAVDALGQEGLPSAPTWHYRTQRAFYTLFVGEWHQ
ncbi:MAG: fibronectin type III domain-containing protein [Planctomycetia bacterium]|nr:fibronectin type III domain-containing protein [Planctomycetia bacterium]